LSSQPATDTVSLEYWKIFAKEYLPEGSQLREIILGEEADTMSRSELLVKVETYDRLLELELKRRR
jgi:hypothetical protein